jgi:hypothetical protein
MRRKQKEITMFTLNITFRNLPQDPFSNDSGLTRFVAGVVGQLPAKAQTSYSKKNHTATVSFQYVYGAAAEKAGLRAATIKDCEVTMVRPATPSAAEKRPVGRPRKVDVAVIKDAAKRGRGRPRKDNGGLVLATVDATSTPVVAPATVTTGVVAIETAPVKRGPGRPRKVLQVAPVEAAPLIVKRGPGRPRKMLKITVPVAQTAQNEG